MSLTERKLAKAKENGVRNSQPEEQLTETPIHIFTTDTVHTLTERSELTPGGRWTWVTCIEYIALSSTIETAVSVAFLCSGRVPFLYQVFARLVFE